MGLGTSPGSSPNPDPTPSPTPSPTPTPEQVREVSAAQLLALGVRMHPENRAKLRLLEVPAAPESLLLGCRLGP